MMTESLSNTLNHQLAAVTVEKVLAVESMPIAALVNLCHRAGREIGSLRANVKGLEHNAEVIRSELLAEHFDTVIEFCEASRPYVDELRAKVAELEADNAELKCLWMKALRKIDYLEDK